MGDPDGVSWRFTFSFPLRDGDMANDAQDPSSAGGSRFMTTHWSLVLAAADTEDSHGREALAKLCQVYWYPLYAFIRRQGHDPHDAQDLTQEFFMRLLEKDYLGDRKRDRFDIAKTGNHGNYLSFLNRTCPVFRPQVSQNQVWQPRSGAVPGSAIAAVSAVLARS
jgi:hypothetical protein